MQSRSASTPLLSPAFSVGIGAAVCALYVHIAQAADPPAVVTKPDFTKLDSNNDGFVDKNEAAASLEVSGWLITGDQNKDGKLSREEFVAIQNSLGIQQK